MIEIFFEKTTASGLKFFRQAAFEHLLRRAGKRHIRKTLVSCPFERHEKDSALDVDPVIPAIAPGSHGSRQRRSRGPGSAGKRLGLNAPLISTHPDTTVRNDLHEIDVRPSGGGVRIAAAYHCAF